MDHKIINRHTRTILVYTTNNKYSLVHPKLLQNGSIFWSNITKQNVWAPFCVFIFYSVNYHNSIALPIKLINVTYY